MNEIESYSDILKNILEERISHNPRYSLRSFARDLDIRPSQLSDLLKGKKGISERKAKAIANRLGLSEKELNYFCDLVALKHARSARNRDDARVRVTKQFYENDITLIHEDAFKIISDWYHYAILELIITDGFRSDIAWIANRLGITNFQTTEAIDRLHRMELIEIEGGKIKSTNVELETTNGIPSQSIRKFHLQILEKAKIAISEQSVKERHVSTLVIAADEKDVLDIGEMIETFKRKCAQKINKSNEQKRPKGVYSLSLVFSKLTKE